MIATIQITAFHSHLNSAVANQHLAAPTAAVIRGASQAGYQEAFLVCAAIMVIPAIVSLFVDNREAEATLQRRVEAMKASVAGSATPEPSAAGGGGH